MKDLRFALLWPCLLLAISMSVNLLQKAEAGEPGRKIRVLYVGGDWKAQLPNYQGNTPLRGFFVRQEVEKAAPGIFDFTLWTSYEFLQYADVETLRQWDVVVMGDVMGQSVLPRHVRAMREFVEGGGGFWYCDNHKAFSFYVKENSFDSVLPIDVVPFRPYDAGASQPTVPGGKPAIIARHPIVNGLNWADAPAVNGARTGNLKDGAVVLATLQDKPVWVVWEKGKGRTFWSGGVFANDELSTEFSKWNSIGKFYVQTLAWLAGNSTYPAVTVRDATASGTLTVDLAKRGPEVTSKHFGIHGQEEHSLGGNGMQGVDYELYRELKLDGTFARTSGFQAIKRQEGGGQHQFMDDGTDITRFDWNKYDFRLTDHVMADLERIQAEPVFLYWCNWKARPPLDPKQYTKYFAAPIEHINGTPGTPEYKTRLKYFEIMNEPDLGPAETEVPRYAEFFNYAASTLKKRYPGVVFGCGGFFEWSYVQKLIDLTKDNLDWFSRHPYGHTGEGVLYLHDRYMDYAKSRDREDLKFIITEWDFWIYGEPAFDYIMMRWKPLIDRADTCLGSLHYRWREYMEGGYVFGIHGEFDQRYGELPPEWPNPGRNKPITYRYNAFWAMRDLRGPQYAVDLDIPALPAGSVADDPAEYAQRLTEETPQSTRAYAVAASDGEQFNIVIYYGYPYTRIPDGQRFNKLELRVVSDIPPEIKGRQLFISRANCKTITTEPARTINGDRIDVTVTVDGVSAVSLTVR